MRYQWVRYDSSGNVVGTTAIQSVTVNQFDYTVHTVVTDSWSPQLSGWEQLHFIAPGFSDSSVTGTKTWSCNGH